MPAIHASTVPRARDRQRRAAGAAQPLQPADDAGDDEEHLQRHVGIQVDAVEQRGKHGAADDAQPPGMHVVAAREHDGNRHDGIGGDFQR
jgi:hypothetical protein